MIMFRQALSEARPFLKDSWALGWPMILIMFFHFAIGITDVYVAGFLGSDVMAAVGYVGQLYWTLMILATGLTVGLVSMVSQAYGAEAPEGVGCITTHSLGLGFAIAGVITVVAGIYPSALVRVSGMPEGIQEIATHFIRIYSLVLVPTYFSIMTGGVLRASGRIRVAMVNSGIAALVNCAGDLILGFGWGPVPAMGYQGIAWASALATTIGMVLNMIPMMQGPDRIRLGVLRHPLPGCLKNLLKLGAPSALQQTAWNAGTLVVYFLVGQLKAGEITALAAMTAGLRIEAIIFLPIFALNMACAVLTGNRIGAGDVAGARAGAKATAILCLAIIIVPAMTIFVFAPALSRLLTNDPSVFAEMARYLRINMIAVPFMAVGISFSGALQGAGDTMATMRIVFTGMWLVRIPLILIVLYYLRVGAAGVWCAMTLSIMILCLLMVNRFRGDAWTTASMDKSTKSLMWEACMKPGDQTAAGGVVKRDFFVH